MKTGRSSLNAGLSSSLTGLSAGKARILGAMSLGMGKLITGGLFAAVLATGVPVLATTEYIFDHNASPTDSDSAVINLNDYGVGTITSLFVASQGSAATQSPDDVELAYADARVDGAYGSYTFSQWLAGAGGVNAGAQVVISNIVLDGNGHWIAGQVDSDAGTQYNVDLGTGSITVSASGNGTAYGYGAVTASIEY